MLKGLGDLTKMGGMLKQAMEMKQRIEEMRESLGDEQAEGAAGGGLVTVTINGRFEVLAVHIDPEVVDKEQIEMLSTLIQAATNSATEKIKALLKTKMSEIAGGFEIPGIV